MIGWILKQLTGALGPYILGVLLAAATLTAGVQSWRVDRLKKDVAAERLAQVNPATGAKWKAEAVRDAAALGVCRDNVGRLEGAVAEQGRKVRAWEADGKRLVAAAQAANDGARAARAESDRLARRLAATPSAATCEGREAAAAALIGGLTR
ncbi:MAG: hypothetical protein KA105_02905 [Caulobacter sp.]|nr:hypothetical protein [Caulobacter sp.]